MRWGLALLIALLVNFGLLKLMQSMVTPDHQRGNTQLSKALPIDFVRLPPEEPPPPAEEPPSEAEEPTPELPRPMPAAAAAKNPQIELPSWQAPNLALPLDVGNGPYLGGFATPPPPPLPAEPVPLVRIPPRYPRRALLRRSEGHVVVQFTIDPDGGVSDPKVVEAEPKGFFEQAALRAIRGWKFQPQLENGVAVARSATQTIRFSLKK
ncbi:energy transducer TonB [Candidatus Endoriftia persephone]|uniref:Protein TonB n=2 Tax=Gammaproteobacteria TaxID=1236 RepID=G2DG13_9GAMM|nr:energy transducer TonB [Candidatus Endoriftia persephone]EGV50442.1 ferric siderophore transport system, periplasmic binding protein TonB [endosymbiont of Riftia pachyptila (vent Ph05)]USF88882.1 energy transducer TonB [Candidatus Endoriftia persephone]